MISITARPADSRRLVSLGSLTLYFEDLGRAREAPPREEGKTLPLVVCLAMFFVYHSVKDTTSWNYASQFLLGYRPPYGTMDFFPLFKWFWLTALGLYVGQSLFQKAQPIYTSLGLGQNVVGRGLVTLGKYSLEIYLVHFVVIFVVQGR